LLDYGFKGKLYALNPRGGEVWGLRMHASIRDIPESVDYVISCIPASKALQLIEDCAVKGVRVVQFFTSGFSEAGTEMGKQLERKISNLARQKGITVVGPNCVGVYCPEGGISYVSDFPKESGSVALICQSGGNTTYLVREAARRGVRFSKVVSYGNAADVDESDLLAYLAGDPHTTIILAYIEGVKDGQRFSRVLREAAKINPIVVLKSGITESGASAAASHTGALSGADRVWDGLLRQVGAVRVYTLDELIDMAVTFSYLPPLSGRRAGVLGLGGGATVIATDECIGAGLIVPRFPQATCRKLSSFLGSGAGMISNNPIDISPKAAKLGFYNTLNILADYYGIDLIMVHFPLGLVWVSPHNKLLDPLLNDVIKAHKEITKPLIVVIHFPTYSEDYEWMLESQKKCYEAAIPVYHSIKSAAKAVDRFLRYHERKRTSG
jgi:acyl-CoA synthetase (NDP forming)